MATLLEEFTALIAEFNRRQIPYAVCGGWAMTIHGAPRATIDIDLMILPEALDAAWQTAKEQGYNVEGLPLNFHDGAIQIKRISKLDIETKALITVDFLLVTEVTREIWINRQKLQWEHGEISTVSREGLIKLKRLSGRTQDLADIEKLEDES